MNTFLKRILVSAAAISAFAASLYAQKEYQELPVHVNTSDFAKLSIYMEGMGRLSVKEYDDMLFKSLPASEYASTTRLPDWLKSHLFVDDSPEDGVILHYLFRRWAGEPVAMIFDDSGAHPVVNGLAWFWRKKGNSKCCYVLDVATDADAPIVPYRLYKLDLSGNGMFLGYGYIGIKEQFFTQPIFSDAGPVENGKCKVVYPGWGDILVETDLDTIISLDSYYSENHLRRPEITQVNLVADENTVFYGEGQVVGTSESGQDESISYLMVEVKPSFMGGDQNDFSRWVASQIVYPEKARENRITGKVTLNFTVDTEGNVTDVRVARSLDPELDAEAVRVVSSSPKWTPGMQTGHPVKVSFVFPVMFQLR